MKKSDTQTPDLKLFKCTVYTYPNDCYVESLLIVAPNKEDAEEQIKAQRRDKYNLNPHIAYTHPLTEIKIDMSKRNLVKVGHGHAESDYESND